MLPVLMMLPLPRAAIFGPSAATRKYAARTLAAKSRSKVGTSSSAVGPNQAKPALLTSTSTGPACSAVVHLGRVGEVGRHEAGLAARHGDRVDDRGAAAGVASVHDDLGAMPAERFGRGPADARGGPGNQGAEAIEVPLVVRPWDVHLGILSRSCLVAILRSKAAAGVSVA